MAFQIDPDDLRATVFRCIAPWADGLPGRAERQVLDEFMQEEVLPLGRLELLDRMGSPGEIIKWFSEYLQTRISRQASFSDDACLCCVC